MDARAVYQAYLAYVGRPPDPTGLAAFTGATQATVIAAFSASAESQALYASSSVAAQVNAIYLNLFGRVAEPAGAAYWLNELSSGRFTLAEMAFAVLNGARNEDAVVVQNKLRVMESFVGQLMTRSDAATAYAGDSAAASARGFLSNVGSDVASLTAALSTVPTAVESVAAHQDAGKTGPAFSISSSDSRVVPFTAQVSSFASSSTTQTAGLDDFRADSRFSGITGRGQTVVVIDSSFDLDHPAFGADTDRNGIADRILYAADFTPERNGANTRNTADDKHGTHVASLVASELASAPGMAPGANLILLQALSEQGSGSSSDIQQALQWVIRNASLYNIVAVNMSLGADSNDNAAVNGFYSDELAALVQLGVVPLVAAGNSYEEYQAPGVGSPASDPNALGVSASNNSTSVLASFSQRSGTLTDIVAPGQGILGASAGGGLVALSGTSMATPIASGAVALAQEIAQQTLGRKLTVAEIYSVLQSSAPTFVDREIASDGVRNSGATFRHLDIKAMGEAVVALGSGAPAPAPSPVPTPSPGPSPAPSPAPTPADDFGDSLQTAGSISAGQSLAGTLEAVGDRDWFGIDLVAGQLYDITLTGGTLQDPYLRVFDANGLALAENDDRGGLDSGLTLLAPSTGRFYVVADSYLSSATGTYSLAIAAGQASDGGDSSDVGSGESDVAGRIDFGGEQDSFNLALSAGTRYTFSLRGADSGVGTLSDPFLELLQSGVVVAENDDGGVGLDSELRFTPTTSGAYSLRASAWSPDETGSYRLQIRSDAASSDPADVPGNTSSQASLANGASASGEIDFGGDEDWFRIDLQTGNEYNFALGGLADSLLTLYDRNGRFVAMDDDGGDGLDALLRFTPTRSGTYYIAASAYSDRETGNYQLRMGSEIETEDNASNLRQAGSLSLGAPVNGVLASASAYDVYTGTLTPGSYRVTVRPGSGADPLNDPFVYVDSDADFFDGLYDDDGGAGLDSSLSFSLATTTSGVIAVGGFDSGSYTLLIQAI